MLVAKYFFIQKDILICKDLVVFVTLSFDPLITIEKTCFNFLMKCPSCRLRVKYVPQWLKDLKLLKL